jgi:hypothetical protein
MLDGILLAWPSRALFLSRVRASGALLTAGETVNRVTADVSFNFTMKDASLNLTFFFWNTGNGTSTFWDGLRSHFSSFF